MERDFTARQPNEPWAADLTYVRLGSSLCYVACVVDLLVRTIVGCQGSTSPRSELALNALEQSITERLGGAAETLVRRADHGGQCRGLKCTERLAATGIEPSLGSRGNSDHNAPAETACSAPSATFPRRSTKRSISPAASPQPWARDSSQTDSGEPGAVHD